MCWTFLRGGKIRVINLEAVLVLSAQKCWHAYQEGLKPASASSLRMLPTLLPWRLTLGVATIPPPFPLIHNHKSRLNCVCVGIPPLEPRLLSPSPLKTLSGTCRGIWGTCRRPSGVETSLLEGCTFTTLLLDFDFISGTFFFWTPATTAMQLDKEFHVGDKGLRQNL